MQLFTTFYGLMGASLRSFTHPTKIYGFL